MEIPEQLRQLVEDAVSRSLRAELDARGLLLTRAASASATSEATRQGAALLRRALVHCYHDTRADERTVEVEFDDAYAATRIGLALAFGSVTANLLTPRQRAGLGPRGSVDLLCATFNLGIGLVDGLCDGNPQLGAGFLRVVQALDVSRAARERWQGDWLRSSLPAALAADPTVAFAARIIEAFFDLLHSCYPGDAGSTLRGHVGVRLEEALAAESQSVDRSTEPPARDELVECSRRTSVLPFQIIELLATGGRAVPSPTAGTLLGQAMWRIDDLVDLAPDAGLAALNALLLAAAAAPGPVTASDQVAALERVLASDAIPLAAAQAAECLQAGLRAAPGATAGGGDRRLFLWFVQSYARIAPHQQVRPSAKQVRQ